MPWEFGFVSTAFLGCAVIAWTGHKGTDTINPGVSLVSESIPSRPSGFVFSGPVFYLISLWFKRVRIPSYPPFCLFWVPPMLSISQELNSLYAHSNFWSRLKMFHFPPHPDQRKFESTCLHWVSIFQNVNIDSFELFSILSVNEFSSSIDTFCRTDGEGTKFFKNAQIEKLCLATGILSDPCPCESTGEIPSSSPH